MNIISYTYTKFKEIIIHIPSYFITSISPNNNGAIFGLISPDNKIFLIFFFPGNSRFIKRASILKELLYTNSIQFQLFLLLMYPVLIGIAYRFACPKRPVTISILLFLYAFSQKPRRHHPCLSTAQVKQPSLPKNRISLSLGLTFCFIGNSINSLYFFSRAYASETQNIQEKRGLLYLDIS